MPLLTGLRCNSVARKGILKLVSVSCFLTLPSSEYTIVYLFACKQDLKIYFTHCILVSGICNYSCGAVCLYVHMYMCVYVCLYVSALLNQQTCFYHLDQKRIATTVS